MKTIRLSQVALLGWGLLMATANAAAQQEQSWLWKAGGVELKLPSTWQEISPSLLRTKVSALGVNDDHVYGAQTSTAGDDLTYPYLLVTIKNGGRMADWQLRQMEHSIRQSVEKSGSQLGRYAWKDGALWVEVTTADVKFMNVMLPTEKGLATLSFYSTAEEFASWQRVFEQIGSSVHLQPPLARQWSLMDNSIIGPFLRSLGHVDAAIIRSCVAAALVALAIGWFVRWRAKAKR
ncbi:MAG: hypothetical protein WB586_24005 [Chthoniobacterales bacterium]